ncbi:MAG: hisS [Candidatus Saccharibacteria bacterium]|nr:hisS [Candidatus Saccharibacteria bacterium]
MALSTQPYKGARDFYPEDKRLQKYMFNKLRQTVERFGYEEYDAPILEALELYTAKTGEEIVNEQTYSFTDRGGRQVVIRPEMTPTVSRMVAAKRQELSYPVRWYSIPNLWRYERPQRGRLREHWQLNVDIFGITTVAAELELIELADAIYKSFGATPEMYEIRINSRKLMDTALHDYLELDEPQAHNLAKLIDRMHKLAPEAFDEQAIAIAGHEKLETVKNLLAASTLAELPEALRASPAVSGITSVLAQLQAAGISNARFDITIMRGFDYYTDIVFEVADTDPENNRSMMGGGRYDGLVGLFGVDPVPTAGFGLGDATLENFLERHNLLPELRTEIDLAVILIGDVAAAAQPVIAELRRACNVMVDISGRKVGDQLKAADKKGITWALAVGESELTSQQFTLKNLKTGQEQQLALVDIPAALSVA